MRSSLLLASAFALGGGGSGGTGIGSGDKFGTAVAIDGDRIAVGAPEEDLPEDFHFEEGAVYVFRLVDGAWVQEARLIAPTPGTQDYLGTSVALSGDVIVAGEPGHSSKEEVNVFRFDGAAWAHEQTLKPDPLISSYSTFGRAVAVLDDTLLVAQHLPGTVYAYEHDGASWTLAQMLVPSGIAAYFGTSIALAGDRALIGSSSLDQAFVFRREDGAWVEEQMLTHPAVAPRSCAPPATRSS